MEFYGNQTYSAQSAPTTSDLVVSGRKRYHSCCPLLCGQGIEVEPPPLCCRLLCGRGIEARPPPLKTHTHTHIAVCYVSSALPLALPLECMWRVVRVFRILGVASGTASGL